MTTNQLLLKIKLGNVTSKLVRSPKKVGGPPVVFSESMFSRERLKPCFSLLFNIIISHIFPEIFIEVSQVVQKI